MKLNQIVNQFFPTSVILDISPFGNGHINSTYKVEFKNSDCYILQKINTTVFLNPTDLINNHLKILEHLNDKQNEIEIPELIKASGNSYLYFDEDGEAWRMMNFIKDSYSVEVLDKKEQAFEAGLGFGWFLQICSGLDSSEFIEAIPDFHKLSFRVNQLNDSIKNDKVNRYNRVKNIVEFYKKREKELLEIEKLISNSEIPVRVVHNDTKINNLLFKDEKAIAVIDLDTVGPGSVLYDFGDAIRTLTNTAAEDEKNLELVGFNLEAFEEFTKAYLLQTESILNMKEKELLHKAPFLMTYIIGIRFLSDYLNGDVYYKTNYDNHNLDRSLVQKSLIEQMELAQDNMIEIIEKYKS
jgi:thiamine kinase-like enzyme